MNSTYLALSAQISLQRRIDTIANNVANATTAGFRAEQIRFSTVLSSAADPSVGFSSIGETSLDLHSGEFVRTDNPFDVAVDGDVWLGITTPSGTSYTRDGRLQMSPTGELMTTTGYTVLDAGGSGLRLDPNGGPPMIGRDGTITQGKTTVGTIGLFTIDRAARLERGAGSSIVPDIPAQPSVDTSDIGIRQGFFERSNVNAITEMTRLVAGQRMFDAVTTALNETEQIKSDAIRTLAGS